jgi:hypothetical protein
MREILEGVWHWTARHPSIGMDVSSYLLGPEGVVLDPMVPAAGLEWLGEYGAPRAVVLTNRHHDRQAAEFAAAFGCPVHVVREGLHEYEHKDLEVTPFAFGDELPGGLRCHPVYSEWPDEGAIEIPRVRALAIADGAVRWDGGELTFVPDQYLGEGAEVEAAKHGLREGYAPLAEQLEPEHLLLAHGAPVIGGGAEALRRFTAG